MDGSAFRTDLGSKGRGPRVEKMSRCGRPLLTSPDTKVSGSGSCPCRGGGTPGKVRRSLPDGERQHDSSHAENDGQADTDDAEFDAQSSQAASFVVAQLDA